MNIINKNYFGRNYAFVQVSAEQKLDVNYLKNNSVDGFIIITDDINKKVNDIKNISEYEELRGLNLNSYYYESITDLSKFKKLEYLNILGKSNGEIPFSSLGSLWCIYLNYDKRSCKSFFECVNLEYIFIDNYTETSSKDFEKFVLIVSSSCFSSAFLLIYFQGAAVATCVGATAGFLRGKFFCDKALG